MGRSMATAALVAATMSLGLAGTAQADDQADPTGEWSWTLDRNGQEFEMVLELKLDGEKLTGALNLPNGFSIDISDGEFKDGKLAFNTEFERNGTTRVTKWSGKVDGDTIKGKTERERDGETRSRDWEAKRVAPVE